MKALILAIILQIICIKAKSQASDLLELLKKTDSATQQITSGQFKLNDSYTKVSVGEDIIFLLIEKRLFKQWARTSEKTLESLTLITRNYI